MKKANFIASLPVSILREGRKYIAYTPALDLSTSGKTFAEAKSRFGEMVGIFFEDIISRGTLEEVLLDCGWEKIDKKWTPPAIVANEMHSVAV